MHYKRVAPQLKLHILTCYLNFAKQIRTDMSLTSSHDAAQGDPIPL